MACEGRLEAGTLKAALVADEGLSSMGSPVLWPLALVVAALPWKPLEITLGANLSRALGRP